MPVPGTNPVQFDVANGKLTVDAVSDPNGPPSNVLDLDLGFDITGTVTMPNWMEGTGQICVYAQEIGGPINTSIGCTTVKFDRTAQAEPKLTTKPWKVSIAKDSQVLPDPQPGASQVYNLVAVFVFDDQLTDIGTFVDLGKYLIN